MNVKLNNYYCYFFSNNSDYYTKMSTLVLCKCHLGRFDTTQVKGVWPWSKEISGLILMPTLFAFLEDLSAIALRYFCAPCNIRERRQTLLPTPV